MFINTFRNFIEIEGLKTKISLHLTQIANENKRISDLVNKRSAISIEMTQNESQVHNLKIKELELKIQSTEDAFSKLKTQMNMVKNEKELASLNHEIEHTKKTLTELENIYFASVETSESLSKKNLELQEFLTGSLTSLEEITNEVRTKNEEHDKEILNYQKRIDALLENETAPSKKIYLEMSAKFKTSSACSFIQNKNCSACRINVDGMTVNNVEHGRSLELCPNCGRILLPNNLNLY